MDYPLQASDKYLLEQIERLAEACIWIAPLGRFHSFYSLMQRKPVKGYMVCMRIDHGNNSFIKTQFLEPKNRRNIWHWHNHFKEQYCKFDTYGEALHAAITYFEAGVMRHK